MTQIFKSKSIYFDIDNGIEITKRNALKNYNSLKVIKYVTRNDESQARGYEYITITIEWWHHCERKRQLQIFG